MVDSEHVGILLSVDVSVDGSEARGPERGLEELVCRLVSLKLLRCCGLLDGPGLAIGLREVPLRVDLMVREGAQPETGGGEGKP